MTMPFYTTFVANDALGHINNLYNTSFWALIQQGGHGNKEAEDILAVCSSPYHSRGATR